MSNAAREFEKLLKSLTQEPTVQASQLFGKTCLKVDGKAFVATQGERVAFKLTGKPRDKANALSGAILWDPSGMGRPMREWIALSPEHAKNFASFAKSAMEFAAASKE